MVKGTKKRGGNFLDDIADKAKGLYEGAKAKLTGTVQPTVDSVVDATGLAPIASEEGATETLGVTPEGAGRTMSGGKKYRKTRKSKKVSKKTMRRKH